MHPVFDLKEKDVKPDSYALGYAPNATEALALVKDAMRRSGTGPKPKRMVQGLFAGDPAFYLDPDTRAWYE